MGVGNQTLDYSLFYNRSTFLCRGAQPLGSEVWQWGNSANGPSLLSFQTMGSPKPYALKQAPAPSAQG